MTSLFKFASKAASLGNKLTQHINTANKLLSTVQGVADQHIQGTNIHKQLTRNIGIAKGHLSTAQDVSSTLVKSSSGLKGGKLRRKRTRKRSTKRSKRYRRRRTKH